MATYYAIRAVFDDPSGTADHDYIYGTGRPVFADRDEATRAVLKLVEESSGCDWGTMEAQKYYVQELDDSREEDWYPAELDELERSTE